MKTIRRPTNTFNSGEKFGTTPAVVANKVGHDIISRSLETESVSLARRRRAA